MKLSLRESLRGRFDVRVLLPALVVLPLLVLVAAGASRPEAKDNPHGQFREDCSQCHGAEAWKPVLPAARRRHAKTGFRLEGAHAAAECGTCHQTLDFSQSGRMCASCHEDPHRGELGVECARCHGARSFLDTETMRRMHQLSSFPLTGSHAALDCEGCHKPAANGHLQFVATRADCQSCHLELARSVRDPDHSAFPTECSQCHSTIGWDGSRFDHARTSFPLTGAHATTACAGCHGDGVYSGKSTACVSCHRSDYDGASPNHAASGFSTDCATCHGTSTWDGATFDHSRTQFPLTGAHVSTACTSCHGDGVYDGKSAACVSCHRSEYDGTRDPNHAAAGFSTDCTTCHGTTTWDNGTFNHSTTQFPLSGAHVSTACSSCHGDGVFAGKSLACVSCHRTEYDATTNPAHLAAGFPTECTSCHGTATWTGATFDHDGPWFPIYSGKHLGKWDDCADCHTSPANYSTFNCLSCHPHSDRTETDGHHQGRAGYLYDSQACYSCHPRGD